MHTPGNCPHPSKPCYLHEGELMALSDARARRIADMATDLLVYRAYGSRGDAIMTLRGIGYSVFDVLLLVDDAIYLAQQDVVRREFLEG